MKILRHGEQLKENPEKTVSEVHYATARYVGDSNGKISNVIVDVKRCDREVRK